MVDIYSCARLLHIWKGKCKKKSNFNLKWQKKNVLAFWTHEIDEKRIIDKKKFKNLICADNSFGCFYKIYNISRWNNYMGKNEVSYYSQLNRLPFNIKTW